ncbi:MAG: GGDEF domain-containing protein [Oscillospiraceae bacterium]|nr:GGDEF domain-containing protein [Oscillospiraceae bacterium]
MNLQAIIIVNLFGIALLVILLISSHLVRQRQQLSDRLFTSMIIVTALACLVEMLTFLFDGQSQIPNIHVLNLLGNSFLYVANIINCFSWCLYADLHLYHDENRIRKKGLKMGIPAIICLIAVILNLKFQFLFSIDENAFYHRKLGGYVFYVATMSYLVYSIVTRHLYSRRYGKDRFFPIYMFLTPILLGATAQYIIYGLSIGWCCTALGLAGIYMSLQNELSYIDPLTKLYNRNYLDHVLNQISRKSAPAGGLMIDLDYFKSINDRFGHTVGDEALVEASRIIRLNIPAKALPIRFAGDEFIILMYTSQETELIQIEKKLRDALLNFNQTSRKKYQLSFSIGRSVYQPQNTTDAFLNEMDNCMYEEKRTKHSRSSAPDMSMSA